jgi:hypothetical protein
MNRNLRRGSKRRSLTAFIAGRRERDMAVVKYFSAASGSRHSRTGLSIKWKRGCFHTATARLKPMRRRKRTSRLVTKVRRNG